MVKPAERETGPESFPVAILVKWFLEIGSPNWLIQLIVIRN